MSAKDEILASITAAGRVHVPMPDISAFAVYETENIVEHFVAAVENAGGKAIFVEPDTNITFLANELYPKPLSYIPEDGGTFVEIVHGRFGVAENGAVWIADEADRNRLFAAANLLITVPVYKLVPTMHEAFRQPDFGFETFGCFIAGPSKTADIEQSLVMGAHGACDVTVAIVG
jgi:L-lactate dehydrogenase complex protein LldG